LLASVAIITGLESPVFLVLVASALAFFISPIIFFLNFYYCLVIIPKHDKAFYPSMFAQIFSWFSLIALTVITVIFVS
jgi:hypothetical protein